MPTSAMIRDFIQADHGISISIRGIADLVADYAQSTPGDRLAMFLSQKCGDDPPCEDHVYRDNTYAILRRILNQNGDIIVNIAYKYTKLQMSELRYPFGMEFWMAELTMERMGKVRDIPILQYVYQQIMAVP